MSTPFYGLCIFLAGIGASVPSLAQDMPNLGENLAKEFSGVYPSTIFSSKTAIPTSMLPITFSFWNWIN